MDEFGTPVEVVDGIFGGREKHPQTVEELKNITEDEFNLPEYPILQ